MSCGFARLGDPPSVNTEQALKSLTAVRPSERVDLLFVVSTAPSRDDLNAYATVAERMAVYDAFRAQALKPLIAAIRRRGAFEILDDSSHSGHLLVRGHARDFSDAATGLLSEIRDLPLEVYPNDRAARTL